MLNTIILQGRLVADPTLRQATENASVASFRIAVERDGGGEKKVDFIDCTAWRQTGEFVTKYFKKGQAILVKGRLESRSYGDRDGNRRTAWEVNVEKAYFAGEKKEQAPEPAYEKVEDGDLPF